MAFNKSFTTIKVSGQSDVVADEHSDELTLAASGLAITTSGDTITFTATPNADAAITDADGNTKIQVEESSDENKIRFDTAGTQRAIIDDSGKVGIGVDSPSHLLDVNGDLRVRGNDIRDNSGNPAITFDGSANVKTPNVLTVDGDGSSGGVVISDGAIAIKTGTGSVAKVDFYCESSNAHKVTLKAPAHADYSGDVNFTLPASNGSNGQALISDGSGNTSWSTISGGGSVRAVGVDTDGNGSTDNTLESGETLILKAGTNVTLAETGGVVTINSSGGGGGGGSGESSDSYTLGYATLNGSSSGNVSDAMTVPTSKTIKAITVDVDTAFVDSYGSGMYANVYFKIGNRYFRPRAAYLSYGSITDGTTFYGAQYAQGVASMRVATSSSTDVALYWSNQNSTLTAGSATVKVYYE